MPSYDATIIMPPMWHMREPWTAPAYICEALRAKGYRVQFLDYNIQLYRMCEKLGYDFLWTDGAFFDTWGGGELDYLVHLLDLDEVEGGVIGISCTQTSCAFAVALARLLRARFPQRKIIFGGHSLYFPHEVERIPPGVADAICKGEGESTICEFLERDGKGLDSVPGLYLPADDGWRLTSERPLERNLDGFAWPRFADINLDNYGKHFLPLMGARGCIGRCVFCQDRYRSPGYRTRSAMNQVDELEYLSQAFDVEHFPYNDPLLNGNVAVMTEKANEILRRGLKVRYGGNMMVRAEMPDELFPLLRQSGLSIALVGVESGSYDTLASMKKRHTPEMATTFLRNLHNAGIKTELNFILGFPTETEEQFEETCQFLRDNQANVDAVISIMMCRVHPSDLFDHREEYGVVMESQEEAATWCTRDGANTPEIRLRRFEKFSALTQELGLFEDHLMGNAPPPLDLSPPIATQFLRKFIEVYIDSTNISQDERAGNLQKAARLKKHIDDTGQAIGPRLLAAKAINSLRRYGLKKAVQRGVEWTKIHMR